MLPRCLRRADIVGRMPSWFRRGYLSCRCSTGRRGPVLRKAAQAALMQLRIGDWAALSAHLGLSKAPIGFEEPIVTLALNNILSRSGATRCRVSGQGGERRQASSKESQARSSFEVHEESLQTRDFAPETFEKSFHSRDIMPHTASLILPPVSQLGVGTLPAFRIILRPSRSL